jgi:Ca2+/Na+ antiporter
MKEETLNKIKNWSIVALFLLCFFGFMIFSYKYKNLNEKYEQAIKEQIDYQKIIDSLLLVNTKNENIIDNLNDEIQKLNNTVSTLDKERERLNKKLKNSQLVITNNISVATEILRDNLSNEEL